MAGQRVTSLPGEVQDDGQPHHQARTPLPAPRRGSDAPPARDRRPRAGRAAARSASGRIRTRRPATGPTLAAALGLPVLGALTDELLGPGLGATYQVLTVLGFAAAAWLATRAGWWWVLSAVAPVVLVSTCGAEYLARRGQDDTAKALAADLARWLAAGFLVMVAALGAALAVVLLRIVLDSKPEKLDRKPGKKGARHG
ncbi:DUF6542 domain-containing protein [Kitasatospora azatica]|uniref:DUF6542 domain-containing protein n=1 Tax=Kitasatospora azatica TaxID=58347 RepID=UPI00068A4914|nr:DUF6542 domain-containing protein [Kitasatospora azatica]